MRLLRAARTGQWAGRTFVAAVRRSDEVLAAHPGAGAWLSVDERARIDRLRHPARRDDAVAAHVLVRCCVAGFVGGHPSGVGIVQSCDRCGGPHGRPRVAGCPDVGVSLSHTGGHVAAIAAHGPAGIDVERVDRLGAGRFPTASVLHPAERAALGRQVSPGALARLWTRKESLVKVGVADLDSLTSIDLSPLALDGRPVRRMRSTTWGEWAVHDLPAEPAVAATAVTCGPTSRVDGAAATEDPWG